MDAKVELSATAIVHVGLDSRGAADTDCHCKCSSCWSSKLQGSVSKESKKVNLQTRHETLHSCALEP